MIDLAQIGQTAGLRGVFSHDTFDKDVADRGEYVITVPLRTYVGRGAERKAVLSVGASPKRPGRFYFAADDRFRNLPGFGCVWPSPAAVEQVSAVPIRQAPGEESA